MGRGGGQVVSDLAIYSNNPSLNPAKEQKPGLAYWLISFKHRIPTVIIPALDCLK